MADQPVLVIMSRDNFFLAENRNEPSPPTVSLRSMVPMPAMLMSMFVR
jgi:hypothetical protein